MRTTTLVALCLGAQVASAFEYAETRDDFTGEASFAITVESETTVDNVVGTERRPFLQLRCDGEGDAPYWRIHWFNPLKLGEQSDLQLRFDEGRVYGPGSLVAGWVLGELVEAEQSVTTYAVNAVLNRALESSTMRARITAFDGRTLDAQFDLTGLGDALEQLRPHCRRL